MVYTTHVVERDACTGSRRRHWRQGGSNDTNRTRCRSRSAVIGERSPCPGAVSDPPRDHRRSLSAGRRRRPHGAAARPGPGTRAEAAGRRGQQGRAAAAPSGTQCGGDRQARRLHHHAHGVLHLHYSRGGARRGPGARLYPRPVRPHRPAERRPHPARSCPSMLPGRPSRIWWRTPRSARTRSSTRPPGPTGGAPGDGSVHAGRRHPVCATCPPPGAAPP